MSHIVRGLRAVNDCEVFTASDGIRSLRLLSEEERREAAALWIEDLESWIDGAEHHAGCSGAFPPHRCKCGLDEIKEIIE